MAFLGSESVESGITMIRYANHILPETARPAFWSFSPACYLNAYNSLMLGLSKIGSAISNSKLIALQAYQTPVLPIAIGIAIYVNTQVVCSRVLQNSQRIKSSKNQFAASIVMSSLLSIGLTMLIVKTGLASIPLYALIIGLPLIKTGLEKGVHYLRNTKVQTATQPSSA